MKKLLGLLAAFGLTASAGSVVVACGDTAEAKTETVEVALTVSIEDGTKEAEVKEAIEKLEIKAEGTKEEKQSVSDAAAIAAVKTVKGVTKAVVKAAETKEVEAKDIEVKVNVLFTEKASVKDLSGMTKELGKLADDKDATVIAAFVKTNNLSEAEAKELEIKEVEKAVVDGKKTISAVDGATLVKGSVEVSFSTGEEA
ncbi:lipoprotein [Spiroplasma endosymbiont of Panorpa germanica]|uniref:lipoprotein n=1 Tax=Spiroplasma endosymbiont of Panorpa germanica TaxID=3066314 RepID=UPI0030D45854